MFVCNNFDSALKFRGENFVGTFFLGGGGEGVGTVFADRENNRKNVAPLVHTVLSKSLEW